jgi:predicted dehydrogenase
MGRHHARAYARMPSASLAGVFDIDAGSAAAVAQETGSRAFDRLEGLLEQVSAVTIAVPTQHHAAVAERCLDAGVACLIEKPLARNLHEGRRIAELARKHEAIVQVGHIERFNPAIQALRRLDIHPRFIEVDRISPMSFRSIDVGVVLDLMIHDLDIVLKLVNSPTTRIDAAGASVIGAADGHSPVEDICNARLNFANGCVANLTASRLALRTERRMRIFSASAYVSVDYQKREGIVVHRSGNLEKIRDAVARVRRGEVKDLTSINFTDLVRLEPLQIEQRDALDAQLAAFIESVQTHTPPQVTVEDGLAALETALKIVDSIPPQSLDV